MTAFPVIVGSGLVLAVRLAGDWEFQLASHVDCKGWSSNNLRQFPLSGAPFVMGHQRRGFAPGRGRCCL